MYLIYNFPKYNKDYAKLILKSIKKKGTIYIHKDLTDYKDYFAKKLPGITFEIIKTLKNCKSLENKFKTFTFPDIYADIEYTKYLEHFKQDQILKFNLPNKINFVYGLNSSGKTRKIIDVEKELKASRDIYKIYNLSHGFINMTLDNWYSVLFPNVDDTVLLKKLEKECKELNNTISFLKGQLVHTKSKRKGNDENNDNVDTNAKTLIETSLKQYTTQLTVLNLKKTNTIQIENYPEDCKPINIPGLVFTEEFDINLEPSLFNIYYSTLLFHQQNNDYYNDQIKFLKTRIKKLESQLKNINEHIQIQKEELKKEKENENLKNEIEIKIKSNQDLLNLKTIYKKKIKNGDFKKQIVGDFIKKILKKVNDLKMVDIIYSVSNFQIKNETYNSFHFSNFEILLFEMAARFECQQNLLLIDETMDIIHTKQQFLKLLQTFPFEYYYIVTHRKEFAEINF